MRKKMKSAVAVVFSLAMMGSVLTGCGESRQSHQDTQESSSQSAVQESRQNSVADEAGTKTAGTNAAETETAGTNAAETETAGTKTAETEAGGKSDQTTVKYEDNFAVDSEAAKEFAEKVKTATADKDLEALADLTAFPVYVGLPDVSVVKTREDFLKLGAETVFTEELLKSVETADIDNFQPSMAGFSISGGGTCNINFGVTDGVLAINGINY